MANKKKSTKNSSVRNKTHNSIDKIIDKAESMNENSKKAMTHMKDKTIMMKENVEAYIQDNLKRSMLIAIGFGAVAGIILVTAIRKNR